MDIEVIEERKNPLLERKELEILAKAFSSTPSRKELIDLISAKLGIGKDLVVIRKIEQGFGMQKARVVARVYDNPDALRRYEAEHIIKRGQKEEKKEVEEGGKGEESKEEPA
ncbi:30S ribosomal protein S24e [Candidatus Micrarchaeota archaeon]|nr:MAG: 30S ribosomal protein S24e [Candidatus Micrarchaeota archaeon]